MVSPNFALMNILSGNHSLFHLRQFLAHLPSSNSSTSLSSSFPLASLSSLSSPSSSLSSLSSPSISCHISSSSNSTRISSPTSSLSSPSSSLSSLSSPSISCHISSSSNSTHIPSPASSLSSLSSSLAYNKKLIEAPPFFPSDLSFYSPISYKKVLPTSYNIMTNTLDRVNVTNQPIGSYPPVIYCLPSSNKGTRPAFNKKNKGNSEEGGRRRERRGRRRDTSRVR